MPQVKSQFKFLKISLLIFSILTISLFINSCSLINDSPRGFSVANTMYLSSDNGYILRFYADTGNLKNKETGVVVHFDYTYDSGIVLGNYTEEKTSEDGITQIISKELVFAYVKDEILYSQNLNLLFKSV